MKNPLKILFVSSEAVPFAKTGGLADVSGSLPGEIIRMGHDVRVVMPYYGTVSSGGWDIEKLDGPVRDDFTGRVFGFSVLRNRSRGPVTYFLENNMYFSRKGLYGTAIGDYPDNALRFSFFSRAVLVMSKFLGFKPDVIHCNDWQTSLIPFYLSLKSGKDVFYSGIKTLLTIHNLAYQGVFNKFFLPLIGIPGEHFNIDNLEFYGKINFLKSGIINADALNAVSRKYAEEILTPDFGCGLDKVLYKRKGRLYGIMNGADYARWDPESDRLIKANYNADDLSGKAVCKKDLMDSVGLDLSSETPLLGYVGRLVHQKGMDLLKGAVDEMAASGCGVIILGDGDPVTGGSFKKIEGKFPGNVKVVTGFDDTLAHKIEAGCDIFLMPSRYEPCGLNQIYSLKYGTIPVVRATGGLDDAIVDHDMDREKGNGFKFSDARENEFCDAVRRALEAYRDPGRWAELMKRAMAYDFSWSRSAKKYVELYEKMIDRD